MKSHAWNDTICLEVIALDDKATHCTTNTHTPPEGDRNVYLKLKKGRIEKKLLEHRPTTKR